MGCGDELLLFVKNNWQIARNSLVAQKYVAKSTIVSSFQLNRPGSLSARPQHTQLNDIAYDQSNIDKATMGDKAVKKDTDGFVLIDDTCAPATQGSGGDIIDTFISFCNALGIGGDVKMNEGKSVMKQIKAPPANESAEPESNVNLIIDVVTASLCDSSLVADCLSTNLTGEDNEANKESAKGDDHNSISSTEIKQNETVKM